MSESKAAPETMAVNRPLHAPEIEVFAVHGADPEVLAYAMAKYSRSALSMKESLKELNEQKAEKFLNTFYFQYGHRSIADLAHVAMAVEKLSGKTKLVASKVIASPQGTPQFYRIAEVHFPSMEALQACAASPGGQETIGHAAKISSGGPPVMLIAEEESFTF